MISALAVGTEPRRASPESRARQQLTPVAYRRGSSFLFRVARSLLRAETAPGALAGAPTEGKAERIGAAKQGGRERVSRIGIDLAPPAGSRGRGLGWPANNLRLNGGTIRARRQSSTVSDSGVF